MARLYKSRTKGCIVERFECLCVSIVLGHEQTHTKDQQSGAGVLLGIFLLRCSRAFLELLVLVGPEFGWIDGGDSAPGLV